MTPIEILMPYLQGIQSTQIPHEHTVQYFCPCTIDRVKRALSVVGETGLQEMIEEAKPADVTCQVCGRKYSVTVEELSSLKDEIRKNSMH